MRTVLREQDLCLRYVEETSKGAAHRVTAARELLQDSSIYHNPGVTRWCLNTVQESVSPEVWRETLGQVTRHVLERLATNGHVDALRAGQEVGAFHVFQALLDHHGLAQWQDPTRDTQEGAAHLATRIIVEINDDRIKFNGADPAQARDNVRWLGRLLLGRIQDAGGSLSGSTVTQAGSPLRLACYMHEEGQEVCAHAMIDALLDLGVAWQTVRDNVRPEEAALIDQHPTTRKTRLTALADRGSEETSNPQSKPKL